MKAGMRMESCLLSSMDSESETMVETSSLLDVEWLSELSSIRSVSISELFGNESCRNRKPRAVSYHIVFTINTVYVLYVPSGKLSKETLTVVLAT